MSLTLIFPGEIQVNIRLLISLKSKEGFKRDIKSILHQRLSAPRTDLIRKVTSGNTGIFLNFRCVKIIVPALRTAVMRRQGIYFCNSRHKSHQRRPYRSSRAYQITVLH